MTIFDFKPVNCQTCGKMIWDGICATGFRTKLDMERITISEEIVHKLQGHRTFLINRTAVSFEAISRIGVRIKAKNSIVLASHICSTSHLFLSIDDIPDYFSIPKLPVEEGIPF